MPQVIFKYDARHVRFNKPLVTPIAKIVADALSCTDENGPLVPEDVEVEFRPFGEMDETRGYAAIIQIDANDYPSRRVNLQERNDNIAKAMQIMCKTNELVFNGSNRKAYVWTRLMPAGFTEFEI